MAAKPVLAKAGRGNPVSSEHTIPASAGMTHKAMHSWINFEGGAFQMAASEVTNALKGSFKNLNLGADLRSQLPSNAIESGK